MAIDWKSEEKHTEKKLLSQEDLSLLAKDIVANAGVGIYIVQQGMFVYVSDLYRKITGYSDQELIGTYSLDHIHHEDKEKVRQNAIKCLKEGACKPYEYRFIAKNHHIIWVLETVTSITYQGERAALGSFIDITERKSMESTLEREEQLFRTITEQSSDIVVIVNRNGLITYVNPAIEETLGFKPEERIGANAFERVHPDDLKSTMEKFHTLTTDIKSPVIRDEIRLRHRNGSWCTLEGVGSNLIQNDVVDAVIINYRDMTKRKQAEETLKEREEKYRTILENIQEGYFEVDLSGNLVFFNDSVCEIMGYPRQELTGLNYRKYTDEETAEKVFFSFNRVYQTGGSTKEIDWQIIRKDGARRYIEASVSLSSDYSDKPIGFKGIIRDITERKQMHQQLNYMATHDPLTGLPNRMLFMDRLRFTLAQSKRNRKKMAVMMLDLDHFKNINDQMGHMVGDKLLKEVGVRLKGILRQNDTVARLGGDEFVVLLSDLEKTEYASAVAKVILKALQKHFVLSDNTISSSASIGIAVYPDDCEDMESLLKKSDMAMYTVKSQGRNNFQFFSNIIN
jgi:diguanylate cyclase (GGDEF)-like protein/PAS domain S-box-containing protein